MMAVKLVAFIDYKNGKVLGAGGFVREVMTVILIIVIVVVFVSSRGSTYRR